MSRASSITPGYQMLGRDLVDLAIAVFRFNVERYPESSNVHDSLGEAYMTDGRNDLALAFYRKSLELDPSNANAAAMIAELAGASSAGLPPQPPAIPCIGRARDAHDLRHARGRWPIESGSSAVRFHGKPAPIVPRYHAPRPAVTAGRERVTNRSVPFSREGRPMSITLLSTPTQLRSALTRLIRGSERIDVFLDAIDDAGFVEQLAAAATAGTEVNVTTNLDASTRPECVQRLVDAGAHVGVFEPAVHRRRAVARFKPGVIIFDNETQWWTAGMVGSFNGTTRSLAEDLEAVTLVEANEFADGNEAGEFLLELLNWGDSVNHAPVDGRVLARHRKACEAAHPTSGAAAATSKRASRVVEVKPESIGYASPLSWQELRRCDWGTYWSALVEADRIRGPRLKDSLCGDRGWLFGLDAAHRAYTLGPDAWAREEVRDDLLGRSPTTKLLGRASAPFAELLGADDGFRREIRMAVERCIVDPSPPTLRDALGTIVARQGVTVQDVSGVLAAAAPDRFFSIASKATQLRMSNVVGFDLSARSSAVQDLLTRYVDAIEVIRAFPWADARSAERTSDHVREPDAWDKRVALLGCLIC